jgi:hypothetical protein
MGTGMDAVALAEVLRAISSNPGLGLTQLNLGCNQLGVSGGEALAAFFEEAKAAAAAAAKEEAAEEEGEAIGEGGGAAASEEKSSPLKPRRGRGRVGSQLKVGGLYKLNPVDLHLERHLVSTLELRSDILVFTKFAFKCNLCRYVKAFSVHDCGLTDTTTGALLRSLEGHPSVSAVDFSRNGGAVQVEFR